MNTEIEIETETEAAPPVDVPRLVLPPGIFKGVPEWSCAARSCTTAEKSGRTLKCVARLRVHTTDWLKLL